MTLNNQSIKVYVNAVYENPNAINLLCKYKDYNDNDKLKNVRLTIWYWKKDGKQTMAMKAFKKCYEKNKNIKSMSLLCTSKPDFDNREQMVVNRILKIKTMTKNEIAQKIKYREEFLEKNISNYSPSQTSQVNEININTGEGKVNWQLDL